MRNTPNTAEILLRLFAGLVYLIAATLKIIDPAQFVLDIQTFDVVPYTVAYATAFFLPWLELLAAVAILTRFKPLYAGSLFTLAALTAFFIALVVSAWARGMDIDCGCFGEWVLFPSYAAHISFNGILLASLAFLYVTNLRKAQAA